MKPSTAHLSAHQSARSNSYYWYVYKLGHLSTRNNSTFNAPRISSTFKKEFPLLDGESWGIQADLGCVADLQRRCKERNISWRHRPDEAIWYASSVMDGKWTILFIVKLNSKWRTEAVTTATSTLEAGDSGSNPQWSADLSRDHPCSTRPVPAHLLSKHPVRDHPNTESLTPSYLVTWRQFTGICFQSWNPKQLRLSSLPTLITENWTSFCSNFSQVVILVTSKDQTLM